MHPAHGMRHRISKGKFSLTGGYFEQPINGDLQKVVFYANGYTGIDTATRYALFRCAEVASEKKNRTSSCIPLSTPPHSIARRVGLTPALSA